MKNVLKHLTSFILPVTVLILVPRSIEKDLTTKGIPSVISGLVFILVGLFFLTTAIISFFRIGKGTLAPWFPTRKLVITGLYQYVRNPMIIGVLLILTGESIFFQSKDIATWTITFFLINQVYFRIYEEPMLERRFGKDYREYKKHVRRWIPRLKPYHPDS